MAAILTPTKSIISFSLESLSSSATPSCSSISIYATAADCLWNPQKAGVPSFWQLDNLNFSPWNGYCVQFDHANSRCTVKTPYSNKMVHLALSILVLLTIYRISTASSSQSCTGEIPFSEYDALADFYWSTNGWNWVINGTELDCSIWNFSNANLSAPCNNWCGIECAKKNWYLVNVRWFQSI